MNIVKGARFIHRFKHWQKMTKRRFSYRPDLKIFSASPSLGEALINKVFIINLDRQKPRWQRYKKEAQLQRVKGGKNILHFTERISAVDGKEFPADFSTPEVVNSYNLKEHFFVDPDPRLSHLVRSQDIKIQMSLPEIAVTMSHIKVWKKMVEEQVPYALILEDDVYFEEFFAGYVNKTWNELPEQREDGFRFDLLFLSHREVDNGAEKLEYSDRLFQPVRGLWWLSGYVLSLKGAEKLLAALPVCGPVDMWINLQFDGLDVYSTKNSIIPQRRSWSSDNSYSILPILERVGINVNGKDKNSTLDLKKKRIFAIGLNKTGTTSLHFALTLLGYKCCHWVSDEFSDETALLIDQEVELPYEAYTDVVSVTERYQELDRQYPDALFILTTRNEEDWIASRVRHVVRNRTENSNGANHSWTTIDIEAWKEERKAHHEEVFSYFSGRPGKLLEIDICGGDEWQPLCEFLQLSIPDAAFPNVDPLIKLKTLSKSLMNRVPISGRNSVARKHDESPWIKPLEKLNNFVGPKESFDGFGTRTGTFVPDLTENFSDLNTSHWEVLETTFHTNLAMFTKENIALKEKGGLRFEMNKKPLRGRDFSSGSLATCKNYRYGRFEAEMKAAKGDGIVSAFFLYRRYPWQEIDIEFLGNDTTKMLVNVYYNPGEEGEAQNFGTHGTPVSIDLGFDSAADFHHYAIEWDPNEIRWFVDDELVHVRYTGSPTPIPNLPLTAYLNLWAMRSEHFAGKLDKTALPANFEVKSLIISDWQAPEMIENIGATRNRELVKVAEK